MPGNYFEAQDSFLSFSFFRRRGRLLFAVAAVAGLALYGAFLYRHTSFAVGGADSSGYLNAARALVKGPVVAPLSPVLERLGLPESAAHAFVPLGFVYLPGRRAMGSLYPIGFPLHEAAAALLLGWDRGPFLVSPLAAVLSLALVFFVGRELGLTPWAAAGAAALLSCVPSFLFQAIQPMSDVVATLWCLAAVGAALRSRRNPSWVFAAGLAFGVAVLVRPMDVLILPALLLALPLDRRTAVRFLLGGIPAAAVLFAYDTVCFGGPLTTGYGLTGHASLFRLANSPLHFARYARWTGEGFAYLPCIGWVAVLFRCRIPWRDRLLVLAWFGFFLAAFGFYDYELAREWWWSRFLLPGMPAIPLGCMMLVHDLAAAGRPRTRRWIASGAAAAIAATAFLGIRHARRWGALDDWRSQATFPQACRYASERLPSGALVLSMDLSGALRSYTDLTPVRWDAFVGDDFVRTRPVAEARGARWFALLRRYEVAGAGPHVPGPWIFVGDVGDTSLWRLEPLAGSD